MYNVIQIFLSVVLTVLNVFSSPIFGNFTAKNEPLDPDNCKLNFAAISDIHMTDEALRSMMLSFGLNSMQNADYRLDALVCAGDITDHGEKAEWDNLEKTFAKYDPADNIIIAQGNHDTWTEDDRYALARDY